MKINDWQVFVLSDVAAVVVVEKYQLVRDWLQDRTVEDTVPPGGC